MVRRGRSYRVARGGRVVRRSRVDPVRLAIMWANARRMAALRRAAARRLAATPRGHAIARRVATPYLRRRLPPELVRIIQGYMGYRR